MGLGQLPAPRSRRLRRAIAVAAAGAASLAYVATTPVASASTTPTFVGVAFAGTSGGWKVDSAGAVTPFGGTHQHGSAPAGAHPAVAIVATPGERGYWIVASNGSVYNRGDARFYGSLAHQHVAPVVGLATLPHGGGYWLLTSNGRVFAYGHARFDGSPYRQKRGGRWVGIAATADGRGYYAVESTGAVAQYGDARFVGSPHDSHASSTPVGITTTRSGVGYWVGLQDGKVMPFGAATTGPATGIDPAAGMAPAGTGYGVVSGAGSVFTWRGGTYRQPAQSASLSYGLFAQALLSGHQPLGSSAEYVSDLVSDYEHYYGSVGVNTEPVMVVPAGQARVAVSVRAGCSDFRGDTGSTIPIPADTPLNGSSDDPVVIDQPSSHTEWELWQLHHEGGSWSACWGGSLDTATSDGVFPYPYGLAASGISYLATDVTESDVQSGSIDHAIALQMPTCTAPEVAPADRTDCSHDPGQPPYGTWFRFPSGLRMPSRLTPFAQMVFRAIQRYGLVLTDQAGAVMIEAESPADWAAEGHRGVDPITASWDGLPEYEVIASLPWSQLEVVPAP